MLLSSLSIALIACLLGYKQSRQLKRAQDLLNKQSLELELVRSLYIHNLKLLSESNYTEEDKWIDDNLRALNK
tara:strand:+ start:238 stop:456 length:219 start_codon:yes stop_codon:yes gene_type:complete